MKSINSKTVNLAPNAETIIHDHYESEIWQVIKGKALVIEADQVIELSANEAIYLSPFKEHKIKNLSNDENLQFISFWWDDFSSSNKEVESINEQVSSSGDKKIFVLPSFPTPNGDLHVGHLAGPYITADIYRRFHLLLNSEVYFLIGTVGHQTQVTNKAKLLNKTFYETAELYTSEINKTLKMANVHPDIFVRPTQNSTYEATLQTILNALCTAGIIEDKEAPALFCKECNQFLFEAHVVGTCPICLSPGASGNECEVCAHLHTDGSLIDPICMECKKPAVIKPLRRLFFPLENFRKQLLSYYQSANLSPRTKAFVYDALSRALPDVPVSHISSNGISIPLPGFENQRIYSIFELPARFICAIKELIINQKKSDPWDSMCKEFHTKLFFGYDNVFLRAFAFPAILMAYKSDINLPNLLVSNEFYNLDHKKFSTSRNHAVWGQDLFNKYPADIGRFYLSLTRPENQQTNFSISELHNFAVEEVSGKWLKWLNRLFEKLYTLYDNKIPEPGKWNPECIQFYNELHVITENAYLSYFDSYFSSRKVCIEIYSLIHHVQEFSNKLESFLTVSELKNEVRTIVALELLAAKILAVLVMPIMPDFGNQLWNALGYQEPPSLKNTESLFSWLPLSNKIHAFNYKVSIKE